MRSIGLVNAALVLVAVSACGGDDGESDRSDAALADGSLHDAGPQDAAGDVSADADAATVDSATVDGSVDGDAGGDAGSDAALPQVAPTTGPTAVSGSALGVAFSSGIAYSDPTDSLGRVTPVMRIILTDWPVSSCSPHDIGAATAAQAGRHFARFDFERERIEVAQGWAMAEARQTFLGDWEWRSRGAALWVPELTSGVYEGGQQVVGKILLADAVSGTPTGGELSVRVNHCGFFDTGATNY